MPVLRLPSFSIGSNKKRRVTPPAKLEVDYHERYGYPTQIAFDFSTGIADDELWINVRRLEDAEK